METSKRPKTWRVAVRLVAVIVIGDRETLYVWENVQKSLPRLMPFPPLEVGIEIGGIDMTEAAKEAHETDRHPPRVCRYVYL